MPNPKIHARMDLKIYGEDFFKEVHSWIDGSFDGTNGRIHWKNRHYIDAVLAHFNEKDYPNRKKRERLIEVALLHILIDWSFYYHRIVLPRTRQDVIDELYSEGVVIES